MNKVLEMYGVFLKKRILHGVDADGICLENGMMNNEKEKEACRMKHYILIPLLTDW